MKHFFYLIVLFISTQVVGQPYLNETSQWKQYYEYSVYPPGIRIIQDIVIQLDGDTMVGTTNYHRVLKTGLATTYYVQSGDTTYHGPIQEYMDPIREGEKSIYAYNRMTQKEYLLYDFGAEVGDTLKSGNCKRDTVIRIDTIYLGDKPRRRFHLPSPFPGDISTLVEGIGSTFGFYFGVCNVITTPAFLQLQCYSQDGDVMSFDSTYDCDGLILDDQTVEVDTWSVCPNPFTDEIEVRFPEGLPQPSTISVVNMMGVSLYQQQVSSGDQAVHISLSNVPVGMYVVCMRHAKGMFSRVVVKG